MQNRYVGDIGDCVKFAILRGLSEGRLMGVAWWLYPDEDHNGDGRHVDYLQQPDRWRAFDPELFDRIHDIVKAGNRAVKALEGSELIPNALYWNDEVPTAGTSEERRGARSEWFDRGCSALDRCDVIFVDPDNGLETKNFNLGARKAGKSVSIAELQALGASGRTLIVYHHQTRMRGGHSFELHHWGGRLRDAGFSRVDALRASPYSARAFFLLNADDRMREQAAELSHRWGERLTWHPSLGM